MVVVVIAAAAAALALPGCDGDDAASAPARAPHSAQMGERGYDSTANARDGGGLGRRMLTPPRGEVRAVPPHAIHDRGIGPYMLDESLRSVLSTLPSGPRVTLLQLDSVVEYSLVRAESGGLMVGAEPLGTVAFIAVLDADIARTESRMGIGARPDELAKELGPPLRAPGLAMSPRLLGFGKLPNARFLLDDSGERVTAVMVRRELGLEQLSPQSGPPPAGAKARRRGKRAWRGGGPGGRGKNRRGKAATTTNNDGPCQDHGAREKRLRQRVDTVRMAAGVKEAAAASVVAACFSGVEIEAVVVAGGQIVVVAGEGDRLRRLGQHRALGLRYAAAMDLDGDGGSEIALVRQGIATSSNPDSTTDSTPASTLPEELTVTLDLLRVEQGRLVLISSDPLYRISESSADWIGAELVDIELLVELRAAGDGVQATGMYIHYGSDGVPDTLAPLLPATVPLRSRGPSPAPAAAGTSAKSGKGGTSGAGAKSEAKPAAKAQGASADRGREHGDSNSSSADVNAPDRDNDDNDTGADPANNKDNNAGGDKDTAAPQDNADAARASTDESADEANEASEAEDD